MNVRTVVGVPDECLHQPDGVVAPPVPSGATIRASGPGVALALKFGRS